jgi:hypothetical protein
MNAFRFRLERVLKVRRTQMELEKAHLEQRLGDLRSVERARAELQAAGHRAEVQVRAWNPVYGMDLLSLDFYRGAVRSQDQMLAARAAEAARSVAEQQNKLMEAQRRCRLLERLRDRRLAEWEAARDRELEEFASEAFLARWNRR